MIDLVFILSIHLKLSYPLSIIVSSEINIFMKIKQILKLVIDSSMLGFIHMRNIVYEVSMLCNKYELTLLPLYYISILEIQFQI